MTQMVTAAGRPRRSYRIEITPTKDGVRIRLDDDNDDEFWQELVIPAHELCRWWNLVDQLRKCPPGFETLVIDAQ